jgi:hypothetical protein
MSDDLTGKTYSFDVCAQCKTICCQDANPPLTRKRQKIIRDYLQEQKRSAENVFVHAEYTNPTSDAQGYCVFFSKTTGKCSIHQVKPETCKAGPITFDINLQTRKLEFFLKKAEICAYAQIVYKNDNQFKEHLEAAKTEILYLVSELEADALKAILKIEEPQTFKIGEEDLPAGVWEKLAGA